LVSYQLINHIPILAGFLLTFHGGGLPTFFLGRETPGPRQVWERRL